MPLSHSGEGRQACPAPCVEEARERTAWRHALLWRCEVHELRHREVLMKVSEGEVEGIVQDVSGPVEGTIDGARRKLIGVLHGPLPEVSHADVSAHHREFQPTTEESDE